MKKFDKYILRSFLGPLILTFLIIVFILMMQFLWLYIDDLVGKGLGFKVIAEFLMWGSATLIPLAMPLACLLASIMTLGGLGENNELLAMKAAGISLQRILLPLTIFTFFICIAAFFASNNLIPLAYKNIYALRYDITHTKEEIRIPNGIFYNGIDNYTLRVDSTNKETHMMYNVMVYDHSKRNGNQTVSIADSGSLRLTEDKQNIVFKMYHGISYDESERKNFKDTTYPIQQIKFDMQEVVIELDNHAFSRGDDDRFGNEIMAQNLVKLGHRRDSLDSLYLTVKEEFHKKWMSKCGFRYSEQLDSAKRATTKTLFNIDSLPKIEGNSEIAGLLDHQIQQLDQLRSQMQQYESQESSISTPLRKTRVEWNRKLTLSFACLIFFFIGAPLGAIIRKGGLGTPTVVSIFFFVIYWVIDITGKKLAQDGVISPILGAWISTLFLFPLGVFLTWKATTDSALLNKEQYEKLFNKIKDFFKSKKEKK